MILIIFLLIPLHLGPPTEAIDVLQEGRRVILQQDIDHVLVRLDMTPTYRAIQGSSKAIRDARGLLLVNSVKGRSFYIKQLLKLLDHLNLEVQLRSKAFDKLFEQSNLDNYIVGSKKRAIEILGDFLSSITGVPSSRDHRRVLEQLRLIKMDEDERRIFLKKATETNKAILESLHFHDREISNTTQQLAIAMNKLNLQANQATQTLEIFNFKSKIMLNMAQVDQEVNRAANILQDGQHGRVNENSIKLAHLNAIIDKITIKQRLLRPVYEGSTAHHYYQLDTAHTWADEESKMIMSLMEIPLADTSESHSVTILKPDNVLHSDLSLAVVNRRNSFYRYLTDSDYLHCHSQGGHKMCQKRSIEIQFDQTCRKGECDAWANIIVHDLAIDEIMFLLPPNQTATLACQDEKERTVILPQSGICRLSTKCSLDNNLFRVNAITFNVIKDESETDIKFGILVQNDALAFKPVTQSQIRKLNMSAGTLISKAMRLNNDTAIELDMFQKNSNARWQNLQKFRTSTEQIIIWSVLITNAIITALLIVQLVTIYIKLARVRATVKSMNGNSFPMSTGSRDYSILETRVAAMESELLTLKMSQNQCKDIVRRDGADAGVNIEEAD